MSNSSNHRLYTVQNHENTNKTTFFFVFSRFLPQNPPKTPGNPFLGWHSVWVTTEMAHRRKNNKNYIKNVSNPPPYPPPPYPQNPYPTPNFTHEKGEKKIDVSVIFSKKEYNEKTQQKLARLSRTQRGTYKKKKYKKKLMHQSTLTSAEKTRELERRVSGTQECPKEKKYCDMSAPLSFSLSLPLLSVHTTPYNFVKKLLVSLCLKVLYCIAASLSKKKGGAKTLWPSLGGNFFFFFRN